MKCPRDGLEVEVMIPRVGGPRTGGKQGKKLKERG